METFFLLTTYEDGWREEEFVYDEVVFDYCVEVLDIPEEKIAEATYTADGIEINLASLEKEDLIDDWYVNLHKISTKI